VREPNRLLKEYGRDRRGHQHSKMAEAGSAIPPIPWFCCLQAITEAQALGEPPLPTPHLILICDIAQNADGLRQRAFR